MESQQHTDNKVMGLDEISAESRGRILQHGHYFDLGKYNFSGQRGDKLDWGGLRVQGEMVKESQ